MSSIVTPTRKKPTSVTNTDESALQKYIDQEGRFPPVRLIITPLDGTKAVVIEDFLTYSFSSSIMIPIDTFSFTFVAPDGEPFYDIVKEGDMATLEANGVSISTGVIDSIDIETDADGGERISVVGRDLLAQFEDQDAVSVQDKPLWANKIALDAAVNALRDNTKILKIRLQDTPDGSFLFATEPGETKISALQRFVEPLNCVFWLDGNGTLVIGKPNMRQAPTGNITVSKEDRISNVTSIKVIRSSTQLANIILPIWSGQESVQERVSIGQRVYNAAEGPNRLRKLGYNVPKAIIVSTPQGGDAQSLSQINFLQNSQGQKSNSNTFNLSSGGAGNSTLMQAHAKREIARANFKEILVQVVVPGHYNDNGNPFQVDTCYDVFYDRGSLEEKMYLFQVEYGMDMSGMKTSLFFCRLGSIVSDVRER